MEDNQKRIKAIRIKSDTLWRLKVIAAQNKTYISEMLEILIDFYEKNQKSKPKTKPKKKEKITETRKIPESDGLPSPYERFSS